MYRVIGEKLFKFLIQLCRKRLVVAQYQSRFLNILDDIRHAKRLATAGYAQQCLMVQPLLNPFGQLSNSCRLVAGRLVITTKLKLAHQSIVTGYGMASTEVTSDLKASIAASALARIVRSSLQ